MDVAGGEAFDTAVPLASLVDMNGEAAAGGAGNGVGVAAVETKPRKVKADAPAAGDDGKTKPKKRKAPDGNPPKATLSQQDTGKKRRRKVSGPGPSTSPRSGLRITRVSPVSRVSEVLCGSGTARQHDAGQLWHRTTAAQLCKQLCG